MSVCRIYLSLPKMVQIFFYWWRSHFNSTLSTMSTARVVFCRPMLPLRTGNNNPCLPAFVSWNVVCCCWCIVSSQRRKDPGFTVNLPRNTSPCYCLTVMPGITGSTQYSIHAIKTCFRMPQSIITIVWHCAGTAKKATLFIQLEAAVSLAGVPNTRFGPMELQFHWFTAIRL